MLTIGVIDTGVDRNHGRLTECRWAGGGTLHQDTDGRIAFREGEFADTDGHGTSICTIIHRHAPAAQLYVLKLAAPTGSFTEELLTHAIHRMVDHGSVSIVNISLGVNTSLPSDALYAACLRAAERGIWINASSYYLYGAPCYPANFSTVCGVGSGIVRRAGDWRFYGSGINTNALAKGGVQRVATRGGGFQFAGGTSIATAHFTGILASRFAELVGDPDRLLAALHEGSDAGIISMKSYTREDRVLLSQEKSTAPDDLFAGLRLPQSSRRIALFPLCEKEINTVAEFADQLQKLELVLGIDYPKMFSAQLFKSVETTFPQIKRLPEPSELAGFDTLVVGYFLDQLSEVNQYFGINLLRRCLAADKHLVTWDEDVHELVERLIKDEFSAYAGTVRYVGIPARLNQEITQYSGLPREAAPVLCVVGTGKRQGKITTQLRLRDILLRAGYRTAFLATEPQGILFGADLVFPFGHNSTVRIDHGQWNRFLGLAKRYLFQRHQPEIILTGCQGGLIPRQAVDMGPDYSVLRHLAYVIGVYPDGIVCTISPEDEPDFILQSVATLRTFVAARVLCYALTPWTTQPPAGQRALPGKYRRLTEAEYRDRLAYFAAVLDRPVLDIMDGQNDPLLLHLVQAAFTAPAPACEPC